MWNYFGNNHGKNPCDPEFEVLKNKLDRAQLGRHMKYDDVFQIYKWCSTNLKSSIWKIKRGSRITERTFHYCGEEVPDFNKFKTVRDTKLFRCVGWTASDDFKRRHSSCACKQSCEMRRKLLIYRNVCHVNCLVRAQSRLLSAVGKQLTLAKGYSTYFSTE